MTEETPTSQVPLLDLAPKLKRPLSLWNPLDYLLLLYWVFYFPQAIRWYVETYCEPAPESDLLTWQLIRNSPHKCQLVLMGITLEIGVSVLMYFLLKSTGFYVGWEGMMIGVVAGCFRGVVAGKDVGIVGCVAGGVAGGVTGGITLGLVSILVGDPLILPAFFLAVVVTNEILLCVTDALKIGTVFRTFGTFDRLALGISILLLYAGGYGLFSGVTSVQILIRESLALQITKSRACLMNRIC
jgi:hypothetical protein